MGLKTEPAPQRSLELRVPALSLTKRAEAEAGVRTSPHCHRILTPVRKKVCEKSLRSSTSAFDFSPHAVIYLFDNQTPKSIDTIQCVADRCIRHGLAHLAAKSRHRSGKILSFSSCTCR